MLSWSKACKYDLLLVDPQKYVFTVVVNSLPVRSKHEEIDLVSEEEFYQEAPQEISRPNHTKNDPHQLTLARLDWELEQRKRYAKLR